MEIEDRVVEVGRTKVDVKRCREDRRGGRIRSRLFGMKKAIEKGEKHIEEEEGRSLKEECG